MIRATGYTKGFLDKVKGYITSSKVVIACYTGNILVNQNYTNKVTVPRV